MSWKPLASHPSETKHRACCTNTLKKLQRCNVFCVSSASNESNVLKHHSTLLLWSSATENISHENMTGQHSVVKNETETHGELDPLIPGTLLGPGRDYSCWFCQSCCWADVTEVNISSGVPELEGKHCNRLKLKHGCCCFGWYIIAVMIQHTAAQHPGGFYRTLHYYDGMNFHIMSWATL